MNRKIQLNLLQVFLIFFSLNFGFSKHIVGGEASYQNLKSDSMIGGKATYKFTFNIYRDAIAGGADFDEPGFIGVFFLENNVWKVYTTRNANISNKESLVNVNDPCVIVPANILYEKGEYSFELTLPIIDKPYMITYQRCCRTNFITNIHHPESTGATYFVEISPESQLLANNSPVFKSYPPAVICLDQDFKIDHSALDTEGDSLVYEFFNPLAGGGLNGSELGTLGNQNKCDGIQPSPANCPPPFPEVDYKFPYSFDNPMGGNPVISIDRFTGIISGRPLDPGQFVIGVRVLEYRNGILIGTIQRDFQFNVTACSPLVKAVIGNSSQISFNVYNVFACGEDTVQILNKSYDRDKIISSNWEFNIDGQVKTYDEWEPYVIFPGPGNYEGKLVLNSGLSCNDSAYIQVKIYPGIHANFDFHMDSCEFLPIYFNNNSYSEAGEITDIFWDFGDGNHSNSRNTNHSFSPGEYTVNLIVEDINNCLDTFKRFISYYPVPSDLGLKSNLYIGCSPLTVDFDYFSTGLDSTYSYYWNFGDGTQSIEMFPIHTYEKAGTYLAKLSIVSKTGCRLDGQNTNSVLVEPSPIAKAYYTPDHITFMDPTIRIINESTGGKYNFWNFDSENISYEFEPSYTFKDTGIYVLTYILTSENNCTDTLFLKVDVSPEVDIFYPNAFSPNGDGVNDEFYGKTISDELINDFQMRIYDRWGGLVFKSVDPSEHWLGSKLNKGIVLPQGVYVYDFSYYTSRFELKTGRGFVTLIK